MVQENNKHIAWPKNSANQTWCIYQGKIRYHFHQPHSRLKHSFGVGFVSLQGSWLSFLGMLWEVTHTSSERLNLICMFSHSLLWEHAHRLWPPLQIFLGLCQMFLLLVHWGGLCDKPKEPLCRRLHRLKVFPPSACSLSVYQNQWWIPLFTFEYSLSSHFNSDFQIVFLKYQ